MPNGFMMWLVSILSVVKPRNVTLSLHDAPWLGHGGQGYTKVDPAAKQRDVEWGDDVTQFNRVVKRQLFVFIEKMSSRARHVVAPQDLFIL